jgi:hypothetical protein
MLMAARSRRGEIQFNRVFLRPAEIQLNRNDCPATALYNAAYTLSRRTTSGRTKCLNLSAFRLSTWPTGAG